MKREEPSRDGAIVFFLIVFIIMMGSGCSYNKSTFAKIKGDTVKVPIQGLCVIEGEGIEAKVNRTVNVNFPSKKIRLESAIEDKIDTVDVE